jgi:hypothetical protein
VERLAQGGAAAVVVRRHARTIAVVLAALIVAGGVVAGVVLTTAPGAPTPALPATGILVRGSIAPRDTLFGDTVYARIDVLYDPRRIARASLAVEHGVSPYQIQGGPEIKRGRVGSARRVTYILRTTCFDHACLPPNPLSDGREEFPLPGISINYRRVHGGEDTIAVPLPTVEVASRLKPHEAATLNAPPHPPVRAGSIPLPVRYGVSPTLLVALLLAGSAVLFAAAGLLTVRFGPRFRRRARPLTPLERALQLVERSRTAGVVREQRKALELLAYELGRSGEDDLALSARVLAWSEPGPHADATTALAGQVRETMNGRANGRAR